MESGNNIADIADIADIAISVKHIVELSEGYHHNNKFKNQYLNPVPRCGTKRGFVDLLQSVSTKI